MFYCSSFINLLVLLRAPHLPHPHPSKRLRARPQHLYRLAGDSGRRRQGTVVYSVLTVTHSIGGVLLQVPLEIIRVSLGKDAEYNDYGFSVSDGIEQKGVFINKIRPGGPADRSGSVRPFDKILQVRSFICID